MKQHVAARIRPLDPLAVAAKQLKLGRVVDGDELKQITIAPEPAGPIRVAVPPGGGESAEVPRNVIRLPGLVDNAWDHKFATGSVMRNAPG